MYYTGVAAMAVLCFIITTLLYRILSKGLSKSAKWQQTTRFAIGSVIALAPWAIAGPVPLTGATWLAVAICAGWSFLFPLLDYLTNRRVSSDIDDYMDYPSGMYLFAIISSLTLALGGLFPGAWWGGIPVAAIETVLLIPLVFQMVYYCLYGGCIDDIGMKVVVDTNVNETIEFVKAFPVWATGLLVIVIAAACGAIAGINISAAVDQVGLSWPRIAGEVVCMAVVTYIAFKPRRGAIYRSSLVKLYIDTRAYEKSTRMYLELRQARMDSLTLRCLGKRPDKPSTIIMVIGESASRDYMKAFNSREELETTPWLSEMAKSDSRHFALFADSYSCAFQTVPALEQALTEKNQYNGMGFHEACSIVDIARKCGYRVSWFSNQGHIGVADTSVSIVAETSDRAQWTRQEVGKAHYDESLLDFLASVDPSHDNFIVLHLKGSHFNFINRYPESQTVWGEPGVQDNVVNYKNSIRYTDSILQRIYQYADAHLNLQAMVYFSDHATIPDKRRSPRFDGFGQCRIPVFVYMSDSYIAGHPDRYRALMDNRSKSFTNDLAYDLMCGIFDIESNHFDPTQSLAYDCYRFTRDMLLTYLGTRHISENTD